MIRFHYTDNMPDACPVIAFGIESDHRDELHVGVIVNTSKVRPLNEDARELILNEALAQLDGTYHPMVRQRMRRLHAV